MFKTRLLSGIVLVIILIATVGTGGAKSRLRMRISETVYSNGRWFTVWISGTDQSDRTVRAL